MTEKKLLAVCGLNCKTCGAYIAQQTNDDDLRKKTAAEWNEKFGSFGASFAPEDINCVGCTETKGVHSGYCDFCPLRTCAFDKKVANCHECSEFDSCLTRQDFEDQTGMDISENFTKDHPKN
jgi:hypothetical protein